ncbi:hypothetical protein CALVIDRAFT_491325 [Calocera viscosa TUFC12733]|uniref:Aspartic peptidase DDI1-type domain-containing protein n=1 Tax=Calocera viscosa (strain TUFC12733) TaxID=1330018 RepID=A0A167FT97_CALVF|nr:hypothetical protein CALVIDRAFT_491325 [Calocera viscosa TUFC12733]
MSIDTDEVIVARSHTPLREIELTLGEKEIKAAGCIDSGCSLVLMSNDLWRQIGVTYNPKKKATIRVADNALSSTDGMIENLRCTIGSIVFLLQVHVVDSPSCALLLGRPFLTLLAAESRDFGNGDLRLTLTCPNTGRKEVVATSPHGSKQAGF